MRAKIACRSALAFFVVAALGVSAAVAKAQATTGTQGTASSAKKPTSTHHGKSTRRKYTARERGQKAPTADRVSEIQTALAKDNSFTGTPNGKWDAATVDAMKKFQESHGLSATGKLDAKTLQKLGLGSQTAGVAAPTPPVSSSSLTGLKQSNPVPRN